MYTVRNLLTKAGRAQRPLNCGRTDGQCLLWLPGRTAQNSDFELRTVRSERLRVLGLRGGAGIVGGGLAVLPFEGLVAAIAAARDAA